MSQNERIAEIMAALAEYDEADLMAALEFLANHRAPASEPTKVVPIRPLPGPQSGSVASSIEWVS